MSSQENFFSIWENLSARCKMIAVKGLFSRQMLTYNVISEQTNANEDDKWPTRGLFQEYPYLFKITFANPQSRIYFYISRFVY